MLNRHKLRSNKAAHTMLYHRVILIVVVLCVLSGCDQKAVNRSNGQESDTETPLKVDGALRVVVLDDELLGNTLQNEWRAISDYEIEVSHQTTSDFLAMLDAGKKRLDCDIVIFPSSLLGQLAEQRLLRPVFKDAASKEKYRDGEIFNLIRRRETQWNRTPYAMSFGSPVLVMLRRTDLVPKVPETWKELNQVTTELRGKLPTDVVPLAQPMSEGWAARMLFTRAASYLYDDNKLSTVFDFKSMEPRIASAAFIRAAEELTASVSESSSDLKTQTPQATLERFLNGKAAIAITLLSRSSAVEGDALEFPAAISEIPGSRFRYVGAEVSPRHVSEEGLEHITVHGLDGRLGAIARSAKNAALANIFLVWATGPEQSRVLCPRGQHTAPFRLSHESSSENWVPAVIPGVASQYTALTKAALNRSQAMQFPRLPSQHRYVAKLEEGVRRMLDGVAAEEALSAVASEWKAITMELGGEKQKSAYQRSLGINTN